MSSIDTHKIVILDSSNITESYPGITLPLTTSFIEEAYYGVFKGALLRLVGDERIVRQQEEALRHMVASYRGRIYYQISNWYGVIGYFPFSSFIIRAWQDMMGVDERAVSGLQKVSLFRKLVTCKNILANNRSVPQEMVALKDEFATIESIFATQMQAALSNAELKALYEQIAEQALAKWDVTLANDMYAFIYTALAEKTGRNARDYLSGIAQLESMKPVRALIELARSAAELNRVEDLAQLQTDEDVAAYLARTDAFTASVLTYIAEYGDRYLEELKLESATYRTNPLLLTQRIVEYAHKSPQLDSLLKEPGETGGPVPLFLPRVFLKRALTGIKHRESSRLDRTRLYGMVRSLFLRIADNLVSQDALVQPTDIFYLRKEEVFAFIDGEERDLKALILARKSEYASYRDLPFAKRVVLRDGVEVEWEQSGGGIAGGDCEAAVDEMLSGSEDCLSARSARVPQELSIPSTAGAEYHHPQSRRRSVLSGTPVSSGRVTGEVLVVENPLSAPDTTGKILVAPSTDPGWVFLLVGAKGIITERGSLLSHTAIISRELGIPSLVGVADATQLLQTGMIITMDGTTGTLEIHDV
jgi:pyruvate,water dikinase